MPKAIKKKKVKKTAIKEEEVKNKLQQTVSTLREKQRVFVYVLSAIVIIAVVSAALFFHSSSKKESAYSLERDAYNYYYNRNLPSPMSAGERNRKALELFQKAIDAHPSPAAQFYIGNCHLNLGEHEKAVQAYTAFLRTYSRDESMLPLVYQKIASVYFRQGNVDEAIKTLDSLAKFKNGIFRDSALILEARHYESAGKPEDAVKKYSELVSTFPLSPFSSEAQARIKTLQEPLPGVPLQSIEPEAAGGLMKGADQ